MTSRALLRCGAALLIAATLVFSFQEAEARAGRGRSFGSRGTSSYRVPARPAPSYASNPAQQVSPGQPGGFLRGLGGGLVGGLLGGMLFRSLGFAGPGFGGGFGLFDLALLAGVAYLLYRLVAGRRQPAAAGGVAAGPAPRGFGWDGGPAQGLAHIRRADPRFDEARFRDAAQDLFFRVQGAWTRRDLSSVEDLLEEEVRRALQADIEHLQRRREVNRLENIAVREVEIVEASQDGGRDAVTLRLLASLLDYTTDEAGRLLSGSDTDPVKFEEYWTLARPAGGGTWKLAAVQQASG